MFHCRPPSNQTPVASSSGLTNSSVSATFGSAVCSIVTFLTPRRFHVDQALFFVVVDELAVAVAVAAGGRER